jgi:hypothetical protein
VDSASTPFAAICESEAHSWSFALKKIHKARLTAW